MTSSTSKYTLSAIALHWLLAALIIGLFGLGWYMVGIPQGSPPRGFYFNLHKSLGIIVAALIVLQFLWRAAHRPPPLPSTLGKWQIRATHIGHFLLFACMVVMVLSGYLEANFTKYGIKFFGILLPPWGPEDKQISAMLLAVHGYTSYLFIALISGHVAAALYHLLVKRDSIFQRMLPRT